MNKLPRISIITPSFNQGMFIEQTILSVLNQNYPNLEYIIIDGGSKDNTVEIIKKYEQHISYWVSEKDKGQSDALNKGFKKATGDIVAWLNSDDWYEAQTLYRVAEEWKKKKFDVLHGNAEFYFGENNANNFNTDYGSNCNLERLLEYWSNKRHCNPPQPSVFMNGEVLRAVDGVDEQYHLAMDYDLWLRIALKGFKFTYVPDLLSHYRFHQDSKSGNKADFSHFYKEWHKVFLAHLTELPYKIHLKYAHRYNFRLWSTKKSKLQIMLYSIFKGASKEVVY